MIMGADLRGVVRRQIPILLEKINTTPAFITGSNTNENISNNLVFF